MPYDSVVCVKQVPDTANVTAEAMKEDGTVNRAALPTIFNPEDLYALETALEIKDRSAARSRRYDGSAKAADMLRECLFRGADRAILITDRRAAASDTLATSYILAGRPNRRRSISSCAAGRPSTATRPRSARNGRETRPPANHVPGAVDLPGRKTFDPPQHRQRLGSRRGGLPCWSR